ncbi:MAG TPA: FAD:protein FMN transferase, partial [Treponemataceae bacterium]|nr:FAD:protein FMN transferase [Treponemataceae bacterium]
SKDSQTPWHIGIRNPELSGGAPVISLHAVNRAMVTSGLNERFFMENGTRYHHILNPETGFPADTDVLSVSILAERALDADALSTILFLKGSESGLKFIEEIPDAEAVYITTSREVRVSSGLQGKILVRNDRFTLAAD